jgi:glycosyltransferase involved in cell wall biosynthesis
MSVAIATLICVYSGDEPDLFRAALQSTIDQRLREGVESRIFLCVDGTISEELHQVIQEYADRLFLIEHSALNRGLANSLNALISRLTDEEFVFRMDADDQSLPDRYQAQLDYLAVHPEIDILGTAITEVDSTTGEERSVGFCRSPQDAIDNIHRRVPVAHPTVCFRRRVLSAVGGYPVAGTNEDVALWFECLRAGFKFDNLAQVHLRFRISEGFWKRRNFSKARSELMCYVRGIYSLNGLFTAKYAYPMLRLMVRLAPTTVSKWLYRSSLRLGLGGARPNTVQIKEPRS